MPAFGGVPPIAAGSKLTDNQIALVALIALMGRRNAAVTAVAVALAESGGNSGAENVNNDGSKDIGLWQINSVHKSNPQIVALLAGRDFDDAMRDPQVNAGAMALISSQGTNWKPWVAFTNGSYEAFANRASSAVKDTAITDPVGDAIGGAVEAVTDIPGMIASYFVRAAYAIIGLVAVGFGVYILAKDI